MRVGGYNERITTYGWDDSDLYFRFKKLGLENKPLKNDLIHHIPHKDDVRTTGQELNTMSLQSEIQFNRKMCEEQSLWGPEDGMTNFQILLSHGVYVCRFLPS